MYKLEIKLKQHTPLIHFQHDQDGATLRASEVKPKLDKFILSKLTPEERAQGEDEGWIKSKNDKDWLDYKMKISDKPNNIITMELNKKREYNKGNEEKDNNNGWRIEIVNYGEKRKKPEGKVRFVIKDEKGKLFYGKWRKEDSKIIYDLDSYPCFFANMGCDIYDPLEYRKVSFAEEPFEIVIITNHPELFNLLNNNNKKVLSSFFLNTNFGTRQSKGFGSFMPEVPSISQHITHDYAKFSWSLPEGINFGNWNCFNELFTTIDYFYKTIRSGINQNDVYLKSLMYFYALDREEYWDKRTIRYEFQHFTPNRNSDKGEKSDMREDGNNRKEIARLYRDMLGLSSPQTWQSYHDVITKEHETFNPNDKIDRFKSPILIKPLYNKGKFDVYLIPLSIPDRYKGADFRISSKTCRNSFIMKTPSEFDVCDFLKFITDEGIVESMRETLNEIIRKAEQNRKNKTKKIAKTILSIFNNIRYVEK